MASYVRDHRLAKRSSALRCTRKTMRGACGWQPRVPSVPGMPSSLRSLSADLDNDTVVVNACQLMVASKTPGHSQAVSTVRNFSTFRKDLYTELSNMRVSPPRTQKVVKRPSDFWYTCRNVSESDEHGDKIHVNYCVLEPQT